MSCRKKDSKPYTVMWWVFGRFTKRPCWFSFSTGWTTCTAQRRGSLADSTWPPPFRAHRFFFRPALFDVVALLFPAQASPVSLFSPDNNHPARYKSFVRFELKKQYFFFFDGNLLDLQVAITADLLTKLKFVESNCLSPLAQNHRFQRRSEEKTLLAKKGVVYCTWRNTSNTSPSVVVQNWCDLLGKEWLSM